ncbi:MAG TPA: methyltransferase domain-containing protein [Nitrospira sp.]|nr:methyltransferase domain-containing protein [Nitrospira sp.]
MSLPEPSLHILLINENADEIKLVTTSLRSFFVGCRIEAGYSSEDALAFTRQGDWQIILIDQDLSPERGLDLLARLRRNAPYAAILLQTNESDSHTAVQALQHGADFLLFKRSPGFLTELLFSVQEALEKRDLQMKLDHTFQRHLRVIETLSDLLYELDADGRFVYVSPTVTAMLGYTAEELAGRHYSLLLPPQQEPTARFRLNERRAGSRSTRRVELTLYRKALPEAPSVPIIVEVTAKGLFDSTNRYLGTVGLLRDLSQQKAQQNRLAELESRLQETDRQLTLSREAARVSRQLQQPLTSLLQDSQRLLTSIQHSRFEQHVETMVAQASQASQLGHQLAEAIHAPPTELILLDLNEVLQTVAQTTHGETEDSQFLLTTQFAANLPLILGSRADLEDLTHILLSYACRSTPDNTRPSLTLHTAVLAVETSGSPGQEVASLSRPLRTYASFTIRGSASSLRLPPDSQSGHDRSAVSLFQAHRIVQVHRGAIEVEHTPESGLAITVRIPASEDFSLTGTPATTISPPPTDIHKPGRDTSQRPERRRSERKPFSLPVQLSIGGTTLRGLLRNMSTEGALLTIRGMESSIHLQPAYVVIKTPVSFLELQGVVHERPSASTELSLPAIKDFVISFALAVEHERNVLRSLLEGLQEGSPQITFEGLILPLPIAQTIQHRNLLPLREMPEDRREAARLSVSCPVYITGSDAASSRPFGKIINLNLNGACIELPTEVVLTEHSRVIHLNPLESITMVPGTSQAPGAEQPLTAQILWNDSAERRLKLRLAATGHHLQQIGIRFDTLSPAQEQRLRSIMEAEFRAEQHLAETPSDAPVLTVSHTVRNREGYTIALRHDFPTGGGSEHDPLVLLCPGYGTTQHAYVALAYMLAGRGFHVVRYDHSRHIGLSDGDPSQTTFTSLEDDLDTVLTFVQEHWPERPLTILAPDLPARIALRRQDWHRRIRRLLLLNPTLDLGQCLQTLHHRDLLQEHLNGTCLGLGNLLGIPLDIDHFLADAVAAQYTDVRVLHNELPHCETEVVVLTGGQDGPDCSIPPPPQPLVNDLLSRLGVKGRKVLLPSSTLTSGPQPPSTLRASWQQVSHLCQAGQALHEPGRVMLPSLLLATSTRARFERDQLRHKHAIGTTSNERLWTAHTELTRALDELPAHWQSIDQLYQLLQPLDGNVALLDIGCGMHSFARLLLLNLSYRLRAQTWHHNHPLRYVGLDFSSASLHAARASTKEALQHLDELFSGRISAPTPVTQQWILGRSADALPFADCSFDRVVANFSLSFVRSPVHSLREFFRVLRPGGKLILKAFTPATDLARLYRPALHEIGIDAFSGAPRLALHRMGQCAVALRTGQLHTFEEESLTTLIARFTPLTPRLVRTLAGQILLAAAEKPDSSS